MVRTGVVVAQLGGPEGLADVEPFIRSIFTDPRLVPLPGGPRTRSAISAIVARMRAPGVSRHYEAIGGGSPIVATTLQQAVALETELAARGHEAIVVVAHRYSRPDTAAAVDEIVEAGVEALLRCSIGGRVDEANAVVGSGCFGEFVECGRDS